MGVPHDLCSARYLFEAADYIGQLSAAVQRQFAGERHGQYLIYPQGNAVMATPETPFLQIGESKYGKEGIPGSAAGDGGVDPHDARRAAAAAALCLGAGSALSGVEQRAGSGARSRAAIACDPGGGCPLSHNTRLGCEGDGLQSRSGPLFRQAELARVPGLSGQTCAAPASALSSQSRHHHWPFRRGGSKSPHRPL